MSAGTKKNSKDKRLCALSLFLNIPSVKTFLLEYGNMLHRSNASITSSVQHPDRIKNSSCFWQLWKDPTNQKYKWLPDSDDSLVNVTLSE